MCDVKTQDFDVKMFRHRGLTKYSSKKNVSMLVNYYNYRTHKSTLLTLIGMHFHIPGQHLPSIQFRILEIFFQFRMF